MARKAENFLVGTSTGALRPIGEGEYFSSPTGVANIANTINVVREMVFGPVVCFQLFDEDDIRDVLARASDTTYGLAASIWTRNLDTAHSVARLIEAGIVWVNNQTSTDRALSFCQPRHPISARLEASKC